jgi:eukaryotic-like serine/threonine-protein kinase
VLAVEKRMIVRLLAIAAALPTVLCGLFGLSAAFLPGLGLSDLLEPWVRAALSFFGAGAHVETLRGAVPAGVTALAGAALLWIGIAPGTRSKNGAATPERGERSRLPPAPSPNVAASPRAARKLEKRAAALARDGQALEAAELCRESGLLDVAVRYYLEAAEPAKAAEIRRDQNRFSEAAELYLQAERFDLAGTLYASHNEYERAAECYRKGGRMSVAAEMYEKANRFQLAGECYMRCEFHRHAAQAFVKVQDWAKAAHALELAIAEDANKAGAGQDRSQEKELKKLVLQAGKLYEEAGDLDAATRVLERGECWLAAGEVALRNGQAKKAADCFERAGNVPKAADALRAAGEDGAAAQILGEYLREKGNDDEAARLLVEAGDYGSAGDLYRKLEDYKLAGECYERAGDYAQAAEMFRIATDWSRAAANYERVQQFAEAAECVAQVGNPAEEARLLGRAGNSLGAANAFVRAGLDDEAIKGLQQVPADSPDFAAASALLGQVFSRKGKHTLAIKKLRQAIGTSELEPRNIDLFYALGTVLEAAGQAQEAVELYEKILTADYHYRDVEARLEAARAAATSEAQRLAANPPSVPDLSPAPAGQVGRYRILAELGRGGMGIVYKGHDTVLDRPVAFKVLPDALRDNPQALKNFLREAKSAAKLNHPNIVTVFDAGEQDGRFYIAMEYVDGTTLKEILKRRSLISPLGVVHVGLQICEALHYAHGQKVIHRDVKTANVMWTREKKAKIMDFGLAKVVEEVRNHTTLVSGTPYYMSPEQTLGKNVDHRTDLYSLGVMLFELATGQLPFREGNVPYHHVHTPAPDPRSLRPELPEGLVRVILDCLQKEAERRPHSAAEVAGLLRSSLGA